jgi:hypothetical protein
MHRKLAIAAALAAITASPPIASAQQRPPQGEHERRPPPGRDRADPGRVIATDIAFARAARDNGQWTAFAAYAAPGAQMHGADGPFDAATFLLGRANPAEPVRWAPTEAWSSCDGSIAVSFGRSRQPGGIVGSYVTVWQRQRGGEYRWIYDTGTPDDPQPPPPPPPLIAPGNDTIIVGAQDLIQARAADCGAVDGLPMDALTAMPAAAQTGGGAARDGTLRWRWEHRAPGEWRVVVDWVRGGAWAEALAFDVPDR